MNTLGVTRALLVGATAMALASCAPSGTTTKDAGSPIDELMGDWQGHRVTSKGIVKPIYSQAIALGNKTYRFVPITVSRQPDPTEQPIEVTQDGDRLLAPTSPAWQVTYANGMITGLTSADPGLSIILRKKVDLSPALGAKPPAGAIILFDGSTLDAWQRKDVKQRSNPVGWKIDEGAMEVVPGTGDIVTKRSFTNFQLHLEFRTPFMPEAREQARGNSGVYLQGRYEVQVLDSYGLKGEDNECGGIYKVAAPRVNMCAPPGQWQSYDVTFHAPIFDGSGNKVKETVVTVVHNGVIIHENLVVTGPTAGGIEEDIKLPGGILLQDHGNLVQYRNIWLVELKD